MSGLDEYELERLRDAAIAVAQDEDELPPPGGFSDVLARAHALGQAGEGDGLEPLIFAARRLAERDAEEREAEGLPPRRHPTLQRLVTPAVIVLLAAASALLVVGGLSWIADKRGAGGEHSQAAWSIDGKGGGAPVSTPAPEPAPRKAWTRRDPAPAPVESAETSGGPDDATPPAGEASSRGKKSDVEERLRALADAAEAALARGELRLADDTLAKLISIGGRHRLVELAYGDRFTIAHRRGIIGEQTTLWRAYLKRFPRGRFADDARAGLCRHAPADARVRCWQTYLDDFPAGAYQAAARRAIEPTGGE